MSLHPAIVTGSAAVQLVDHGNGHPLTLEQAIERTAHLAERCSRSELAAALAYLGCQIVGYRQRADHDAALAIQQIARIVHEHQERTR